MSQPIKRINKIKYYSDIHKLKGRILAKKIGVSYDTILSWFCKRKNPGQQNGEKLCVLFKLKNMNDLFE